MEVTSLENRRARAPREIDVVRRTLCELRKGMRHLQDLRAVAYLGCEVRPRTSSFAGVREADGVVLA
jgi:hypothetical protein